MFCTRCGVQLNEQARFCSDCGTATGRGASPVMRKHLTRSLTNKRVAGVCGGLGEHFDADPVVIRLLWVILTLALLPVGIVGYLIAWMMIPRPVAIAYPPVGTVPVSQQT